MKYMHPHQYKGIKNQNIARLCVEENCLKCDKFMGHDHDFSECNIITGEKCPKPFIAPALYHADEFVKLPVITNTHGLAREVAWQP